MDGEGAARYIKSTNNKNTHTPIIAVSAYSGVDPNETSNVFAASLSKPLQKADLLGESMVFIFMHWILLIPFSCNATTRLQNLNSSGPYGRNAES